MKKGGKEEKVRNGKCKWWGREMGEKNGEKRKFKGRDTEEQEIEMAGREMKKNWRMKRTGKGRGEVKGRKRGIKNRNGGEINEEKRGSENQRDREKRESVIKKVLISHSAFFLSS